MAQQSQFASGLIDQTVQAFNGDVTTVSPMDGISLIDNWISALRSGDESTNPIASSLSELKLQLQSGNPNGAQIQGTLEDLADQTKQMADSTDGAQQSALNELASSLRSFSQQLAGGSGSANTGGNAPGGPTTGGISSSGGSTARLGEDVAGAGMSATTGSTSGQTDMGDSASGSAYGSSEGTRNQSTYNDSPDAGNVQGGGSYGSGYGTGSSGEDNTDNSGTDQNMSGGR